MPNSKISVIMVFASLIIMSSVDGLSRRLHSNNHDGTRASLRSQAIIESSCSTTLYPDICYSTLSEQKVTTKKNTIELAINKTKDTIRSNFHIIEKKLVDDTANLTKRGRVALQICLEMIDGTLEELDMVIHKLRTYPTIKSRDQDHADDLKTILSTTITNMDTCIDELSFDTSSHKLIIEGHDHGEKMCSNVLAMVKNMIETDIAKKKAELNNVEKKASQWPEWVSLRDRKLFGLWRAKPNVVVSKDGKGNYTTVAEAVENAPSKSKNRYIIQIAEGVYKENVKIPKDKYCLMFIGDGRDKTIITGNKNVAGGGVTTTTSATVAVEGDGFLAQDITFQNTAGPSGGQAVALRVASDKSAFYRCAIDGYQDTLYVHSKRQFYVNCLVIGTVDFIFGNAAVVFQFCDIQARRPNRGQRNMVTAQGRKDPNQNTGIVIQHCRIEATSDLKAVQRKFSTYLGRPWREYSRTVVTKTVISDVIKAEGWNPWDKARALDTLYYREYKNKGPGANTSKRVTWKGWGEMKTNIEAIPFTVGSFINGWSWLLSTGFPFWPGW